MNAIQWLDFSSAERDDVMNLLAAQQDKSTQDELGVGLVRDAIADHLFPPLSTIQTRAKYFLYVPWLLRQLEQGNVAPDNLDRTLRQRELALIRAMRDAADRKHLIGGESGDQTKRLPSSIYWAGIRRLGIYSGDTSLAEYLDEIPERRTLRKTRVDEIEYVQAEHGANAHTAWDVGLPADEPDFLTATDFTLDAEQARYLKEKILAMPTATGRSCLLQWMICHLDTQMLAALDEPWTLLAPGTAVPELPAHLRRELTHARNFSLCARVLTGVYYRLLVTMRRDTDTSRIDGFLLDSVQQLADLSSELSEWARDRQAFWQWIQQSNPRLERDRPFIDEWLDVLAGFGFAPQGPEALTTPERHRWMQRREHALKGSLARMTHPAVLQRWKTPDALGQMDYRWRTAKLILQDILHGIHLTEAATHA